MWSHFELVFFSIRFGYNEDLDWKVVRWVRVFDLECTVGYGRRGCESEGV